MIGSLKEPIVSVKFMELPLLDKGRVGVKEGIVMERETADSLELAGEVGGFWEPSSTILQSFGTTFLLDLEVVVA